MTNNSPDNRPNQHGIAGNDLTQGGGDINQSKRFNLLSGNVMLFVCVGILALGALAWTLGVRIKQGQNGVEIQYQNQQQQSNPIPSAN